MICVAALLSEFYRLEHERNKWKRDLLDEVNEYLREFDRLTFKQQEKQNERRK